MVTRKFYIVGHNPNTAEEAESFLRSGANALGPDICFENGKYYVSHGGPGSNPFTEEFALVTYLDKLRKLIADPANQFNLAMLFFDIKDPAFDINEFLQVVHEHFSKFPVCSGVAIMVTTADLEDADFLNKYDQSLPNAGIGIDQCDDPTSVLAVFSEAGQRNVGYADGITTLLNKGSLFNSISEAKYLQDPGAGFKMVFTWVIKKEESMRDYLRLYVDGIFVDLEEVPVLLQVLKEPEFALHFELAANGHNPWTSFLPPVYKLEVRTRDQLLAGTDSRIRFTLTGSEGALETVINAGYNRMMESGTVNHISLEGKDIGVLNSLSMELLEGGIAADWLPEYILVQNSLRQGILFRNKGNEWLTPAQPLTLRPDK